MVCYYLFLLKQNIKRIDTLLISHGDNDHAGGVADVMQTIAVNRLLTSVPKKFKSWSAQNCYAGQQWQWDGIHFSILAPDEVSYLSSNNRSCVLLIDNGRQRILLPGDIEKAAEQQLVQQADISANIIVAPHHGSNTSSIENFVRAVNPQYVVFATGFANRWGFPKPIVVARYRQQHAFMYNSALTGAISWQLSAVQDLPPARLYRAQHRRFWWG